MTPSAPLRALARNPVLVWAAFILAHLWLGALNLYGPGQPFGDVTIVYKFWVDQALVSGYWVGVDGSWVYPIVALVPMLVSWAFGPELFPNTWLSLVLVLDLAAFGVLTGWGARRNTAVAWWWVAFLVVLGPIAVGRIDSITVPLAIVGVLLVATRPAAATVILTVATWIKVWPAALIAAILIAVKARRQVVVGAAVTSLAIIAVTLSFGAGANVFSFVTQQSVRGLQVEAPISTIWLWQEFAGAANTFVYYDQGLLTWQVRGPGVEAASVLMNPLMILVVLAITVLAVLAARNRVAAQDLLPSLSLAYVVALIAFNKVGSPQYITWLAVPVILGLATNAVGRGRPFRTPAMLVLVIAGLTQLIYPYLYGYVLGLHPVMLIVLSARNLLYFVLLGWAVVSLWRASRDGGLVESPADRSGESWLPAIWPFGGEHTDPDDRDRLGEDELAR
ncbi:glycosyltransferase 87 family protein [Lacisediminihabitans sp. FW035]